MENKLNELNIFALRDFARRTGVTSPTSKKKEELIKEIVEILSGEKQPKQNRTKQGRPPKVFGYEFSNVFNVQSLTGITLNQKTETYSTDDIKTVVGYVELVNNNSALLWVNENLNNQTFFIPSEVVMKQKLRNGDRVVAEVVVEENQCRVKNIFSVNGVPQSQQEERMMFETFSHVPTQTKIEFVSKALKGLNLCVGENVYFYGNNNSENTKTMIELLNNCKIENKIYVNISLTTKNKNVLQNLKNAELFVANITDEISVSKRVINLAIERAKRVLEIGEKCVLVIDDMLSISEIENSQLMKNLASLSMESDNGGAITLMCVMPNESLTQIEKLADKRFEIENGLLQEK